MWCLLLYKVHTCIKKHHNQKSLSVLVYSFDGCRAKLQNEMLNPVILE